MTSREDARARQDGDYEAPVLVEPAGGEVPEWDPDNPDGGSTDDNG